MTRPRRSALFLPASNARAIEKARALPADVVMLDLEDAVAPAAKGEARAAALAAGGFGAREWVIRVNALDTPWGADDLDAVALSGADAVLVPKVTGPDDVDRYAKRIAGRPLWAMIETAAAFGRLQAIADRAPATGLAGFVLGANDLALELGTRPQPDRRWLRPFLALMLAAARSRGLVALDAVCNDFSDDARLTAEASEVAALGYDGKSLIHPRQIEPCNAAFAPSPDQLAWAVRVRDGFAAGAGGAVQVDGRMAEALHLEQARRLLAMAGQE